MKNTYILLVCRLICLLCCCCCCQSARQNRFSWSYDDMVAHCKPWMSIQVKTEDGSGSSAHKISFRLSTSSIINGGVVIHTSRPSFTARGRAPCLYQGSNINTGESVFASETRGLLKITFKHKNNWYRSSKLMNSSTPAVAQALELDQGGQRRCQYKTPPNDLDDSTSNRTNSMVESSDLVTAKGLPLTLSSFPGSAPTKILELVVVLDTSFVNMSGGESNAVARVMQITNYVNGIYQALSLKVVLTNIIVWSDLVIPLINDATSTLYSFTEYKAEQLDMKHDTAVLLSAIEWYWGVLGVAWRPGLCRRIYSCSVVTDRFLGSIKAAWTMAHEIGHNLGFRHIQEVYGCHCSAEDCIMNAYVPSSISLSNFNWSTCSLDALKSQANEIWGSCLAEAPDTSYYSSRSPMCGNGILETGEQCDCGPAQLCSSKCCNAATCQLKIGAECASGPCCDRKTCSLRSVGDECRSPVGICDVPETCSGTSEWCPSDDKVADGVECAIGKAYCYDGQCKTTDARCQEMFSSSARTADAECFAELNIRNVTHGHCEKRLVSSYYLGIQPTYSYSPCEAEDVECGLLHCYRDTVPVTGASFVINSTYYCYSQSDLDTTSSGVRSPSLVPNGAKCGNGSMCINSTCVPLSSVTDCPDCPDCNGNGVLTSGGLCFCKPDFAPPNCTTAGCGGSETSPLSCIKPTTTKTPVTTVTTPATTPTTPSVVTEAADKASSSRHRMSSRQSAWQLVLASGWAVFRMGFCAGQV